MLFHQGHLLGYSDLGCLENLLDMADAEGACREQVEDA